METVSIPFSGQVLKDLAGEVQARGGAGHGPGLLGEHGLVVIPVGLSGGALDIRRQRHFPLRQHLRQDLSGRRKPHLRHPGFGQGDDLRLQIGPKWSFRPGRSRPR